MNVHESYPCFLQLPWLLMLGPRVGGKGPGVPDAQSQGPGALGPWGPWPSARTLGLGALSLARGPWPGAQGNGPGLGLGGTSLHWFLEHSCLGCWD